MKFALALFCLTVFTASLAIPQAGPATAKKKTTPVASKTAAQKTPGAKTAATTKKTGASVKTSATTKTGAASKKGKSVKKAAAPAVYRQIAPTPERYKEIQQALAEKGYLKSEPNGVWNDDSAEALKQFQTEKNLPPTGKITAASLIGLGLGPKAADASGDKPSMPAEAAPAPQPSQPAATN